MFSETVGAEECVNVTLAKLVQSLNAPSAKVNARAGNFTSVIALVLNAFFEMVLSAVLSKFTSFLTPLRSNALSPIVASVVGRVRVANDSVSLNAFNPMLAIFVEDKLEIEESFLQLSKLPSDMLVNVFGSEILVNPLFLNKFLETVVIVSLSNLSAELNLSQFSKTLSPRLVKVDGNVTPPKTSQFLNA